MSRIRCLNLIYYTFVELFEIEISLQIACNICNCMLSVLISITIPLVVQTVDYYLNTCTPDAENSYGTGISL